MLSTFSIETFVRSADGVMQQHNVWRPRQQVCPPNIHMSVLIHQMGLLLSQSPSFFLSLAFLHLCLKPALVPDTNHCLLEKWKPSSAPLFLINGGSKEKDKKPYFISHQSTPSPLFIHRCALPVISLPLPHSQGQSPAERSVHWDGYRRNYSSLRASLTQCDAS